MKRFILSVFLVFVVFLGVSFADDPPIPITAEQAFDAVQNQSDPISGETKSVALIDVRTRAEYFWVGAACQVEEITTSKGDTIVPDNGKVFLTRDGKRIEYELNGKHKKLQLKKWTKLACHQLR